MLTRAIFVKEEDLLFLSDRAFKKRASPKSGYADRRNLDGLFCFEMEPFTRFANPCIEDAKPGETNFPSCRELLLDMGEQVIEDFVIELLRFLRLAVLLRDPFDKRPLKHIFSIEQATRRCQERKTTGNARFHEGYHPPVVGLSLITLIALCSLALQVLEPSRLQVTIAESPLSDT